jgi:hypothetical protein
MACHLAREQPVLSARGAEGRYLRQLARARGVSRVDQSPDAQLVRRSVVSVTAILDGDVGGRCYPAESDDEFACVPAMQGRQEVQRSAPFPRLNSTSANYASAS